MLVIWTSVSTNRRQWLTTAFAVVFCFLKELRLFKMHNIRRKEVVYEAYY
jgi:hypothetical protein